MILMTLLTTKCKSLKKVVLILLFWQEEFEGLCVPGTLAINIESPFSFRSSQTIEKRQSWTISGNTVTWMLLSTKYMGNTKDGKVISNWRNLWRFHNKDCIWTTFYVIPKVEKGKWNVTSGILRCMVLKSDRQGKTQNDGISLYQVL